MRLVNFRQLREVRGLSLLKVSQGSGVNYKSCLDAEHGREILPATYRRLAEFLASVEPPALAGALVEEVG